MATKIVESSSKKGEYFINGKLLLLANWEFHEKGNTFTSAEKKAFTNYLKSISK